LFWGYCEDIGDLFIFRYGMKLPVWWHLAHVRFCWGENDDVWGINCLTISGVAFDNNSSAFHLLYFGEVACHGIFVHTAGYVEYIETLGRNPRGEMHAIIPKFVGGHIDSKIILLDFFIEDASPFATFGANDTVHKGCTCVCGGIQEPLLPRQIGGT